MTETRSRTLYYPHLFLNSFNRTSVKGLIQMHIE